MVKPAIDPENYKPPTVGAILQSSKASTTSEPSASRPKVQQ
jgi:hypothetical protein